MNPDLNLAFLQVSELQSMNPDLYLESMINLDLDLESLLVLDSKLGLGIPANLGLGIHEPRLELGIPAGLRVAIHERGLYTPPPIPGGFLRNPRNPRNEPEMNQKLRN
jgi:hypothetical protein